MVFLDVLLQSVIRYAKSVQKGKRQIEKDTIFPLYVNIADIFYRKERWFLKSIHSNRQKHSK